MHLEIIHPEFKINLQNQGLTLVEENNWFNDQFFVKYTFPVTFELTNELDVALGQLQDRRVKTQTAWEVKFLIEGRVEDALCIIEGVENGIVTARISSGYEQLPGWDTKLSELDLEKIAVTGDFYAFAEAILTQTYPAVNYNFPKIKTPADLLDVNTDQWASYEGYINNYVDGNLIQNDFDNTNNISINRNVLQPMPYLLHILKTAFTSFGYELQGDVLEDIRIKETTLVHPSSFYLETSLERQEFTKLSGDYDSTFILLNATYGVYTTTHEITEPGRYKIAGNFYFRMRPVGSTAYGRGTITVGNNQIYQKVIVRDRYSVFHKYIDIDFDILNGDAPVTLQLFSEQYPYAVIDGQEVSDQVVWDLSLSRIATFDANNNAISTLVVPDKIKLNECVPDITFGTFFKALRNLINLDLTITDGTAIVNKIENNMFSLPMQDISHLVNKRSPVDFPSNDKFYLRYNEVTNDLFNNEAVLVDEFDGDVTTLDKDDDSTEIKIDLIPLPREIEGAGTAVIMEANSEKLQIAIYKGLIGGINITTDHSLFDIENVYEDNYRKWLFFRLNTAIGKETFKVSPEQAREINVGKEFYAYQGKYIAKSISKTFINKDEVEIEIEIYRLAQIDIL